jgi:hypothetical protein
MKSVFVDKGDQSNTTIEITISIYSLFWQML